ncbi:MAG: thioredoxin family protein [Bacteroidetes bacterium]|nr:thioredoxin family protein [Bacteroidota bacterium]
MNQKKFNKYVNFRIIALIPILAVIIYSLNIFASGGNSNVNSAQGIQFRYISMDEAIEIAKLENKVIFVDAYADWCGPCRRLARTTFLDSGVASLFNHNFINVKMNIDQPLGKIFSHSYRIQSLPTLLFLDTSGNELQRTVGTIDPENLITLASPLKSNK